jgi:hypothetical protein
VDVCVNEVDSFLSSILWTILRLGEGRATKRGPPSSRSSMKSTRSYASAAQKEPEASKERQGLAFA